MFKGVMEGKQRKERADGAVLKNFQCALMRDLEFQIAPLFLATGVGRTQQTSKLSLDMSFSKLSVFDNRLSVNCYQR